LSKKRLSGQYKVNLDTGVVSLVGSMATEHPNLERQTSLLDWGEDKVKLERWGARTPRVRVDCSGVGLTVGVYRWIGSQWELGLVVHG
jgi:hypothetical protein